MLGREVARWREALDEAGVPRHAVVSLEGDYDARTIGALLALASSGAVLVPISRDAITQRDVFLRIAEVEWRLDMRAGTIEPTRVAASHPLYATLKQRDAPGLVLFTSGSTGRSKGAVHDLDKLAAKFATRRKTLRTLVFLQPDHIGGINTLFYTLSNNGVIIVPERRDPEYICDLIAKHQVELLPVSPTFLNLLLLNLQPGDARLQSLRLVTYGTEPMPERTLARVREMLPHVQLQQTYGLTEIGILRSQSRPDGSLWVRVGGEGYDVKIVDGCLWVKASSAMLGYLNAPSPFSEDGYLNTGDEVEVDGEWLRILGRRSEVINVGGSKVHPSEVESVLLELPNIQDVVVRGLAHPLTGQIVAADVTLVAPEPLPDLKARLRAFCADRLPSYKVPVRIQISDTPLYGARFKRQRGSQSV
jgi:acyl-coenzyme A synthetase/AMP-(fatty) acid ligase